MCFLNLAILFLLEFLFILYAENLFQIDTEELLTVFFVCLCAFDDTCHNLIIISSYNNILWGDPFLLLLLFLVQFVSFLCVFVYEFQLYTIVLHCLFFCEQSYLYSVMSQWSNNFWRLSYSTSSTCHNVSTKVLNGNLCRRRFCQLFVNTFSRKFC